MEHVNPVALVTGGAVRVGRAISLGLAESGYDVVVNYHTSGAAAAEVTEEIRRLGPRALAVQADVSAESDVEALAQTVRTELGRLDVLVNSASNYLSGSLLEISTEDWDRAMSVNVRGPFLVVRHTADLLRSAGGCIINMVDLSAFQAWVTRPHHSVSKAALLHLTKVMARALAPSVRVNAIAPGNVLPPEDQTAAQRERSLRATPLGRIGQPQDVVEAVRFLTDAAYVTGAVIVVDGGRLVSL